MTDLDLDACEVSCAVLKLTSRSSCAIDIVAPIGVLEVIQVDVVPRVNVVVAILHVTPSEK